MEMSINDGPFHLAGAITSTYASYVPLGEVRTMRAFVIKPKSVLKGKLLVNTYDFDFPYHDIVLWDKPMIPELNQGQEIAFKFIEAKQNQGHGQDWKYHPKTWLALPENQLS